MKNINNLTKITAFTLIAVMLLLLSSCAGGGYGSMAPTNGDMGMDLSGEGYTEIIENAFINTSDNNTSYFSIDANTASYPNLRNMITNG